MLCDARNGFTTADVPTDLESVRGGASAKVERVSLSLTFSTHLLDPRRGEERGGREAPVVTR